MITRCLEYALMMVLFCFFVLGAISLVAISNEIFSKPKFKEEVFYPHLRINSVKNDEIFYVDIHPTMVRVCTGYSNIEYKISGSGYLEKSREILK